MILKTKEEEGESPITFLFCIGLLKHENSIFTIINFKLLNLKIKFQHIKMQFYLL
jgi:hypothetical protein